MPLVSSREILTQAREKRYGVPSLLAGNVELVVGSVMAAEKRKSPLILPFNQEVTLAISFGNAHGVYRGEPNLDLDRVRKIHACLPSLDLPSH